MLKPEARRAVRYPADRPPLLCVVIDTEEDFDWAKPLSRDNRSVASIAAQGAAQDLFARFGLVPTYVVDHPVATDPAAVAVLRGFLEDGRCEIGAHLHPWVNPPDEETVTPRNSFPGNLPPDLERRKLMTLTDLITESFGRRPIVYKAGRFGIGPATGALLAELGYRIDASLVPYTSFVDMEGPDFSQEGHAPFWFGPGGRLLELPLSAGFAGCLRAHGRWLFPPLSGRLGMACHAPGIAARLGLLERIRLTPEGVDRAAHRRLTESLLAQGCRIFTLTYHSPSLAPGNTPYVRTAEDLADFLGAIEAYLGYFLEELGGEATTPTRLYNLLSEAESSA